MDRCLKTLGLGLLRASGLAAFSLFGYWRLGLLPILSVFSDVTIEPVIRVFSLVGIFATALESDSKQTAFLIYSEPAW